MRAIERVGIADVERARPAPLGVELGGADRVEALGALAIAFSLLGTQRARPVADRVDRDQLEARAFLGPQLQLGFRLEDADHQRKPRWNAFRRQAQVDGAGFRGLGDDLVGIRRRGREIQVRQQQQRRRRQHPQCAACGQSERLHGHPHRCTQGRVGGLDDREGSHRPFIGPGWSGTWACNAATRNFQLPAPS